MAVPFGHPWHLKHYNRLEERVHIEVHGGLTYSANNHARIGAAGQNTSWWLGFDCGHYNDGSPRVIDPRDAERGRLMPMLLTGTYRTFKFVEEQCSQLAIQIYAAKDEKPWIKP